MRALAAAFLLTLCTAAPLVAADPFTSGKPAQTAISLAAPPFGGGVIGAAAKAQRALNAAIAVRFHAAGTTGSGAAVAGILLLSFAYGVLHALGPGHGKVVVAGYFVARRERWVKSLLFGSLISLIQGGSAIALVGLLGLILKSTQTEVLGQEAIGAVVSYALILLFGLWMLYRALTNTAADHAHRHHHGALAPWQPTPRRRHDAGTALVVAAGLTPCASAIIVLLFAVANGVFVIGIGAALAMSVGMAITVSAVGATSILGRRLAERLFAGNSTWVLRLERALAIAGPVLIVAFSALLLLGAWSQL